MPEPGVPCASSPHVSTLATKVDNDFSPRKTMLVLMIVVGCFAVLLPKVFYPMLVGSADQHAKPSPIDKTIGCCDVISETDVNTIKIMSEICGSIIKASDDKLLTGKEIVEKCEQEIMETCGINISVVLEAQVRLGQNIKQILDEVRSSNSSLCLKYNYGVAPWSLGVPHRITVNMVSGAPNIRQERPLHVRSELIHPAFRERGRAIPQVQPVAPSRPVLRVVEGRPGPIPGMRPTIGGAGHVVPPSKQGASSMSVIMPIYTIGIVVFFAYTLMKILFKKHPQGIGGSLYPPLDLDPHFRKEVFESETKRYGPILTRENVMSKLVVNAMSALLDEVDQEIEARRKSSEVTFQDLVNGALSNGNAVKPQDEEQPTIKVLGVEMTASCESGKKWLRARSPIVPISPLPSPEPSSPPQEIYLEGVLPGQSHLLVANSATERQSVSGDEDPAVVLAGKVTLSVISLDENGIEEVAEIGDIPKNTRNKQQTTSEEGQEGLEQLNKRDDIEAHVISFENEDIPNTVEILAIRKEVNNLILEAVENIEGDTRNAEIQITENVHEARQNHESSHIANNVAQDKKLVAHEAATNEARVIPETLIQDVGHTLSAEGNELTPHKREIKKPNEEKLSTTNIESLTVLEEIPKTTNGQENIISVEDVIAEPEGISSDEVLTLSNDPIEIVEINETEEDIQLDRKETTRPMVEQELTATRVLSDDDDLGSDEEIVEEIEEILYESNEEEVMSEETDDEETEEIPNEQNRRHSNSVERTVGQRQEDQVKELQVRGTCAVKDNISDEELTSDEEIDDE